MAESSTASLAVVIPVYNGAESIGALVKKLEALLAPKCRALQVILVNDASPDDSLQACLTAQKAATIPVIVLDLAKNFGEHNAVMAGLSQVTMDYAVIMDDDFQNPPEEVFALLAEAEKGYDVVYSYYDKKQHAWWRNLGSKFNDLVATVMLKKPRDLYLSSFKLVNAFLIGEVLKYNGPFPYIDGLILRTTKRIGRVKVSHSAREAGRSNYTMAKLVRLWLNMFTSFSIYPLRAATVLGLLLSGLGVLLAILVVIEWFFDPGLPIGWASIMCVFVLFSGMQLLLLGVVGEYVGRIFMLQNSAPQFVIRERYSPRTDA